MSWEPINLRHLPDDPPTPPDYAGLAYRRRRHWFSGEPGSTKTIAAYAILLEAIRAGERVALIDFEMGQRDAKRLLREMGATDDDLDALDYFEPDDAPAPATIDRLVADHVQLVVLDAAAGAFDVSGLDENRDAEKFNAQWVNPLWRAGLTTIVLDHVVKNREARGQFASGHHRKIGGTEVHLGFVTKTPLRRGGTGVVSVTAHKDRPGFHRKHAGTIELQSDPETHSITWTFKPDTETDTSSQFRPTVLMQRVSAYLAQQTEPVSRTTVEKNVTGTNQYLRLAMDALVAEGYARHAEGGHANAKPILHVRPFTGDPAVPPNPAVSPPTADSFGPAVPPYRLQGGGAVGGDKTTNGDHDPAVSLDDHEEARLLDLGDQLGLTAEGEAA